MAPRTKSENVAPTTPAPKSFAIDAVNFLNGLSADAFAEEAIPVQRASAVTSKVNLNPFLAPIDALIATMGNRNDDGTFPKDAKSTVSKSVTIPAPDSDPASKSDDVKVNKPLGVIVRFLYAAGADKGVTVRKEITLVKDGENVTGIKVRFWTKAKEFRTRD